MKFESLIVLLITRVSYTRDADEHSAGTSQPEGFEILKAFPVSTDGSAPPAKRRKEAGFPAEDRSLTDKWNKIQRDQRAEFLLCKYSCLLQCWLSH